MGKGPFCFGRKMSRRRPKKSSQTATAPAPPSPNNKPMSAMVAGSSSKTKKKAGGAKLWMRLDKLGQSELMECDKSTIIKRVSIPARDLRILGPIFSHSSHILAREKAMVVNLEFIKAIVTAEEVLLLDPLCQEVLPFVDQLRQQLPHKSVSKSQGGGQWMYKIMKCNYHLGDNGYPFLKLLKVCSVTSHLSSSSRDCIEGCLYIFGL